MLYRVYLEGIEELHYVMVETEGGIDATEKLNRKVASAQEPFVELGGQAFRSDRVVAVAEEVDWTSMSDGEE